MLVRKRLELCCTFMHVHSDLDLQYAARCSRTESTIVEISRRAERGEGGGITRADAAVYMHVPVSSVRQPIYLAHATDKTSRRK